MTSVISVNRVELMKCPCSMCPCKNDADNTFSQLCVLCRNDIHAKWTKKWMKKTGVEYIKCQ